MFTSRVRGSIRGSTVATAHLDRIIQTPPFSRVIAQARFVSLCWNWYRRTRNIREKSIVGLEDTKTRVSHVTACMRMALTNGGAGFFPFLPSEVFDSSSSRIEIDADLCDLAWLDALSGQCENVASLFEVAGVSGGVLCVSGGEVQAGGHW